MGTKRAAPRRLRLSPTKISAWLACHLQYKFTYIDRLSRYYYKPNRGDTFGASMHRALQMFHEAGGVESITREQFEETLRLSWTSTGYKDAEEEKAYLERGRHIVQKYYDAHVASAGKGALARTLFTEKQLSHSYADFSLIGRLDRLDEREDGTLEIVDYKSNLTEVSEADVHASLAMACYALLVGKRYPDRPVVASIVGLAGGCSASTTFSSEEMDVLEEEIKEIARQIIAVEEYEPNYSPACLDCIFARICYPDGVVDWESRRKEYEASREGAW